MKRFALTLFAVLLAVLNSHSMEVGGIDIPERRDDLHLLGAGVLRKGLFFKVYAGALYIVDNADAGPDLSADPKRLDIYYYHNTPKKYMIRAAEKTLRRNLSREELTRLRPAIDRLHDAYIDGRPGTVASIVHRPGEGLVYLFNGHPLLTIEDDQFANAYFSIWLGDRPSSRSMKKALLNGHCKDNPNG